MVTPSTTLSPSDTVQLSYSASCQPYRLHRQVPFIGGTSVINLSGVHQNPSLGKQVCVLAVIPVHVGQDYDVDVISFQTFFPKRLDKETPLDDGPVSIRMFCFPKLVVVH
ncbi:MAG: hypothetical protein Ct9H300mP11_14530 [Chloroflexota bacterium]|nr:MAG: hypothetical protein Ct9H300mP11_14530 [Chloroflexota bacterium]